MRSKQSPIRFGWGARCAGSLVLAWTLVGGPAAAALHVVTTLPELGDLVREVGGDRVEVTSICKGYQDPHYLEAKPSYARSLRKADLLVYGGLELEVGWLPRLLDTARNPKLRPGTRGLLEASTAVVHFLEVPEGQVDRSQGDVHPFGNPHFMLDPRNGIAVAKAIGDRLGELDPEGSQIYRSRFLAFRDRLQARIEGWETQAEGLRGADLVAYHKQWEYLAGWLGFDLVDYIENRPGIPPTPRHVQTLIDRIRREGIPLILAATFVDLDAAGSVAKRGGARLTVLPASAGGVEGTDSYEAWFETIVNRLLGNS